MSTYHLRAVATDGDFELAADVMTEAFFPDFGVRFTGEYVRHDWNLASDRFHRFMIVSVDGQDVGFANCMALPTANDDKQFFVIVQLYPWLEDVALYYHILGDMIALAQEQGADMLRASYTDIRRAAIDAIGQHGFTQTYRYPSSMLALDDFDPAAFAAATARVTDAGIALKTLPELAMDAPERVQALYALSQIIVEDDPGVAHLHFSLDEFKRFWFEHALMVPAAWIVALDGDQFVGTSWGLAESDPTRFVTNGTVTARAYRRRGITTAMKVLQGAQLKKLGFKYVTTGNREDNPMYQINLRLGFQPKPANLLFEKQLSASAVDAQAEPAPGP